MFKTKKNVLYLILGIIILVVITNISLGVYLISKDQASKRANSNSVVTSEEQVTKNTFSYKGVEGKNALEILQSKTKIEQSSSGLVVSINGRKTEDRKKEFWAFYVNGKMAEVGPADYETKDGDAVEWKIDHY